MSLAHWSLLIGLLLLTMLLLDSFLPRLPFTVAMIYLGVGYVLGPDLLDLLATHPFRYAGLLELATGITLLIALFAVGLQLGVPIRDLGAAIETGLRFDDDHRGKSRIRYVDLVSKRT
jgi:hypothetical protein